MNKIYLLELCVVYIGIVFVLVRVEGVCTGCAGSLFLFFYFFLNGSWGIIDVSILLLVRGNMGGYLYLGFSTWLWLLLSFFHMSTGVFWN